MKYASFVWSPHTAISINKLESVQRRATQFVMSNYDRYSSVSEMLSMLNWVDWKEGGMHILCQYFTRFWTIWLKFLYLTVSPQAKYGIVVITTNLFLFNNVLMHTNLVFTLLWNNLPSNIVNAKTYEEFQDHVQKLYNINLWFYHCNILIHVRFYNNNNNIVLQVHMLPRLYEFWHHNYFH